ncbi:hypothetical protein ACLESO_45660 [Pyxidicoccus sp. 3LG]
MRWRRARLSRRMAPGPGATHLHSAQRFDERAEAAEAQVLVLRKLVLGSPTQDVEAESEDETGPRRQRQA